MLAIVGLFGCWPYVATFGYAAFGFCLDKAEVWPVYWLGVGLSYACGMLACLAWFITFNF